MLLSVLAPVCARVFLRECVSAVVTSAAVSCPTAVAAYLFAILIGKYLFVYFWERQDGLEGELRLFLLRLIHGQHFSLKNESQVFWPIGDLLEERVKFLYFKRVIGEGSSSSHQNSHQFT